MDGSGDWMPREGEDASAPPLAGEGTLPAGDGRRAAVVVMEGGRVRQAPPSSPEPAYLYTAQRRLCLGDLAPYVPRALLARAGRRASDIEVFVVKLSARSGRTIRSAPSVLADCLFIDTLDLDALRDGHTMPRVEDAIRDLLERRLAGATGTPNAGRAAHANDSSAAPGSSAVPDPNAGERVPRTARASARY